MFFYRRVPIVFGQEVGRLLREVRGNLSRVKVPVLIMQGRCDYEWGPLATIPADSAQILFNGLGTTDKEIVVYIRINTLRINYLRFYFRFIWPHQGLLEQRLDDRLWELISEQLRAFVGETAFEELCRCQLNSGGLHNHTPSQIGVLLPPHHASSPGLQPDPPPVTSA